MASSHQEPPPTTIRAATAPARKVEIRYGEGCRQKERHAPRSETLVRREPVIRSSSAASRSAASSSISGEALVMSSSPSSADSPDSFRAARAVSRLAVAGRSTRSAAARAVSGSPSPMAAVRTR